MCMCLCSAFVCSACRHGHTWWVSNQGVCEAGAFSLLSVCVAMFKVNVCECGQHKIMVSGQERGGLVCMQDPASSTGVLYGGANYLHQHITLNIYHNRNVQ